MCAWSAWSVVQHRIKYVLRQRSRSDFKSSSFSNSRNFSSFFRSSSMLVAAKPFVSLKTHTQCYLLDSLSICIGQLAVRSARLLLPERKNILKAANFECCARACSHHPLLSRAKCRCISVSDSKTTYVHLYAVVWSYGLYDLVVTRKMQKIQIVLYTLNSIPLVSTHSGSSATTTTTTAAAMAMAVASFVARIRFVFV